MSGDDREVDHGDERQREPAHRRAGLGRRRPSAQQERPRPVDEPPAAVRRGRDEQPADDDRHDAQPEQVAERLRGQIVLADPGDQPLVQQHRQVGEPPVPGEQPEDAEQQQRVGQFERDRPPRRERQRPRVAERADRGDRGEQGRPLLVDVRGVGHPVVLAERLRDADVLVDPRVLRRPAVQQRHRGVNGDDQARPGTRPSSQVLGRVRLSSASMPASSSARPRKNQALALASTP